MGLDQFRAMRRAVPSAPRLLSPPFAPALAVPGRVRAALVAAGFVTVALVLYGPGLHGSYYGDDLFLVFSNPERLGIERFFIGRMMHYFRPLDHYYLARVQAWRGLETWPIHTLALLYHLGIVGGTYVFGRVMGLAPRVGLLAAAFVLVHEVGPYGVVGVDTGSQMGGTFWGICAMVALGRAVQNGRRIWYAAALGAYIVALLYKETSASFFPLALVLVLGWRPPAAPFRAASWRARLRSGLRVGLPFAVIFGLYLLLRYQAVYGQPSMSDTGRYGLNIGLNIPLNLAKFFAAAVVPASTVEVYLSLHARAVGPLLAVGAATLLFVGVIVLGLRYAGPKRRMALLAVMLVGALFPAALLNHVSELYFYNALPYAALLVGMAGDALWRRAGQRGGLALRGALAVGALALAGAHMGAVRQKVTAMVARGEEARRLMATVVPAARSLPPGGRLALRNAVDAPFYSVFVLPGVEVLRWGETGLVRFAGRPDVEIVFAEAAPVSAGPTPGATRTFVHEGGRLVEVR